MTLVIVLYKMCTPVEDEKILFFVLFSSEHQINVANNIWYPKVKIETTILSFDKKYINTHTHTQIYIKIYIYIYLSC